MKRIKDICRISFFIMIVIFFILPTACEDYHSYNPQVFETDSVIDIDGNVYKTVKIGNRWWMAENLKVKRYRNGDSIIQIGYKNSFATEVDSATWVDIQTGAYCIINNKDTSSNNYLGKRYGFLYNGYAINDIRNIAPAGWHIPSDEEWKEMERYLGMGKEEVEKVNWRGTSEGNKLKIQRDTSGAYNWYENDNINKYKVWGSNESGFSALAGSCVLFNGIFGNPGVFYSGFWWTSTQLDGQAWYRYMDYQKANVFRYYGPLTYGFSVRCIKD